MNFIQLNATEWDVVHTATGHSIAWIQARLDGSLQLMSTSAPLTDAERAQLAAKIADAVGGAVLP